MSDIQQWNCKVYQNVKNHTIWSDKTIIIKFTYDTGIIIIWRVLTVFKITMIHNWKAQIHKVDSMQKWVRNGNRENETLGKNQKEMIKIKHTVIYMKNNLKDPSVHSV